MVNRNTAMDDDCKEYRKNKRQQKLYSPGSGPLRRSSYGLDEKMDAYGVENISRSREHSNHGSFNSVSDVEAAGIHKEQSATNARLRKPEQQLYVPRSGDASSDLERQSKISMKCDNTSQYRRRMPNKQNKQGFSSGTGSYSRGGARRDFHYKDGVNNDINYNRQYRPTSETRSISPTHSIQEPKVNERNRDSRSMETSGRGIGGCGAKPPSGRRNSAGYSSDSSRSKYMINLDNVPPRFRKKYLEQQAAHQSVEHINRDRPPMYAALPPYNQAIPVTGWSQTLPVRGRGRLREHPSEGFDGNQFINTYLKNYEVQNSRKSTPSNSYTNLYEPNAMDNRQLNIQMPIPDIGNQRDYLTVNYDSFAVTKNGTSNVSSDHEASHKHDSDNESESISQISSQIIDMTLDWTEEVEKNIKLDDTSASFSQNLTSSSTQDIKSAETSIQDVKSTEPSTQDVKSAEPKESKRSSKSRRKDRRSSSRGKKSERNQKDSTVSVQNETERIRRDSNVSAQHEAIPASPRNRDRERRDSHRSNRSSNLGNSRDDLDRWRSLRSYSRERSTEGRIVSQCNSRDASANRAVSPRDSDGFRIPSAASKSGAWPSNQALNLSQKKNGTWNTGRTPSTERCRQSPAPSTTEGGEGGSGRRRQGKKSSRRRGGKQQDVPPPTPLPPGATPAPTNLNWREEILESKKYTNDNRQPQRSPRTRLNNSMSEKSVSEPSNSSAHPGILILPQNTAMHLQKDQSRGGSVDTQKLLYDPQNPSKPIVVQTNSAKLDSRIERSVKETSCGGSGYETGEAARAAKHHALLQEVDRADLILRTHTLRGPLALATYWDDVIDTRKFLQNALQRLLMSDLKYCQADNIEHNFWKILYYNFIETLRKSLSQITAEDKPKIVKLINLIIQEGNEFFENLVHLLEKTYKFNTDDYINDNHLLPPKGLGYVGLALISVQKLYVFLGDLARYKEQVNDTNNYAKSKFWYTKAQQINPKNGRPYNQLAILAIYARRKLDAVYYYMRSLMSSNPFHSARESLLSLFDENSKKYEAAERKRRAAIEVTRTGENGQNGETVFSGGQGLRREVWVRPSGHRTTTVRHDTRDEQLASMTPVELNKTFLTSYLHVHGKLITKIGMETFHESASAMLRQFRALLHRQPLPTPAARLLQLTALNMFAVESTAAASLRENDVRSAWVECALGVALLMFGALLERCCALLPEPAHSQHHADALLLLPAIKVWSDWMLCHSSVWNPPPTFVNFEVDSENDPWDWLAMLMNILEELDDKSIQFETEMREGHVAVRLPEDASLAGFTPLMYMEPAAAWSDAAMPPHAAEHTLRARKLLFFGTEYLVGVEPPVLKLEYPAEAPPRYVSAVLSVPAHHVPLLRLLSDSSEEMASGVPCGPSSLSEEAAGADAATRQLLRRKEQLETRRATLERRRQHVQEILRGGCVSVEVEVRPRWLVPDTNCFIDHLALLRAVAAVPAQPYLLAVPLVVMAELEGLCRCSRLGERARASLAWVSGGASGVRLATSRGSLLASRTFTAEHAAAGTNDDRVLATALNLHANLASEPDTPRDENTDSKCVKRVREVVLLTDDRNLRVKALAAELPARDLPSFIQWAGLDPTTNSTKEVNDSESGHTSK